MRQKSEAVNVISKVSRHCIPPVLNRAAVQSCQSKYRNLTYQWPNLQKRFRSTANRVDLNYADSTASKPSMPKSSNGVLYDVAIIGGGVTGSALLYQLSAFTDLKNICLVERRSDFSRVASGPNNNSQTIHCGDIETNYTIEKAATVKRQADMLRNFGSKLDASERSTVLCKMQKMALAVGEEECDLMERRFEMFKKLFPRMQLIDKARIAEVEPTIAYGRNQLLRPDRTNAIFIEGEDSAVNYYDLTKAFVKYSQRLDKNIDVSVHHEVRSIMRLFDGTWLLSTNKGPIQSRFVVSATCGYSLVFAQSLGYGKEYSCFPVAGSYYFSKAPLLRGKVYTVQNPKLPFAAVHGDPDLVENKNTRFGPTALVLPMLERHNLGSIKGFLQVLKPDLSLLRTSYELFKSSHIRNYLLRNYLFEIPVLCNHLMAHDIRKIVPGVEASDIKYAAGFGGVRPQLVNKNTRKLQLGEGKVIPSDGANIIFNITPSPGGTTCLGSGEVDMRCIAKRLNARIDEDRFREVLLEGEYPVS